MKCHSVNIWWFVFVVFNQVGLKWLDSTPKIQFLCFTTLEQMIDINWKWHQSADHHRTYFRALSNVQSRSVSVEHPSLPRSWTLVNDWTTGIISPTVNKGKKQGVWFCCLSYVTPGGFLCALILPRLWCRRCWSSCKVSWSRRRELWPRQGGATCCTNSKVWFCFNTSDKTTGWKSCCHHQTDPSGN